MKTFFYKKGIILLATLFVAGITLSCHDADDGEEQEEQMDQEESRWKFKIGKFVKHVDDITATVHFNQTLDEWYLMYHIPFTIDSVHNYYSYGGLGKFEQEDLKVVLSGDVYEINIKSEIAGNENFCVAVTSIREWTEDDRLGYWYFDDFIELLCCDPNAYYVQARATENPISQERVEEILTSLGAEITYAERNYFLVNAKQRPVHPDLFVSPKYKPIDRRWGDSELWVNPRISIKLNEGASLDEVLSKYGAHIRVKESSVESPYSPYRFDCDLSTAEEILRLAATIHLDPDVNWCEPSKMARIILDYSTKTNVLQIESENYSGTLLADNPHCYNEKELRYERDGSSHMLYHLRFGYGIKESSIFDGIEINIESRSELKFSDLKVGDIFDSGQVHVYASYTPTWMEAIPKYATTLSGQLEVVDKKTVDGEEFITLGFRDFKFDSIDKTCLYTVNGTIDYKVWNIVYK